MTDEVRAWTFTGKGVYSQHKLIVIAQWYDALSSAARTFGLTEMDMKNPDLFDVSSP